MPFRHFQQLIFDQRSEWVWNRLSPSTLFICVSVYISLLTQLLSNIYSSFMVIYLHLYTYLLVCRYWLIHTYIHRYVCMYPDKCFFAFKVVKKGIVVFCLKLLLRKWRELCWYFICTYQMRTGLWVNLLELNVTFVCIEKSKSELSKNPFIFDWILNNNEHCNLY